MAINDEMIVHANNEEEAKDNSTNAAIMTQMQFSSFVKSHIAALIGAYNLSKITVDTGTGNKGVVKVNKNGELEINVSFKEVM